MTAETSPTTHLSSLAVALHAVKTPEALARVFVELAEEALALSDTAPTEHLWEFWLRQSEDFRAAGIALRQPPKQTKQRWFW